MTDAERKEYERILCGDYDEYDIQESISDAIFCDVDEKFIRAVLEIAGEEIMNLRRENRHLRSKVLAD